MSAPIKPPAKNPCGSCPYRRDVPSGIWSEEEYDKLPNYDLPTGDQPPNVFLCHQQNGRMCAGWTACHDMEENMGVRLAVSLDQMSVETLEAARDYTTNVPLFSTGAEAKAHGMANVEAPTRETRKAIAKLDARQKRKATA